MPPLERVLTDYDLGLLRVIAGLWGLELNAPTQREAAAQVSAWLREPNRVSAQVAELPEAARAALEAVRRAGGRWPLARFTRAHGEVRAMGPARREREQPWRVDPSPAEALWYRALTGHGFFESEGGPQEFVFIPEDLLTFIPEMPAPPAPPPGQPAPAPETFTPAEPFLADDMVTLLAYAQITPLRLEGGTLTTRLPATVRRFLRAPEGLDLCFQLALDLKLLSDTPLKPDPTNTSPFLDLTRAEQTRRLAQAWRASPDWNDLRRMPGLTFEGAKWRNDPALAREAILRLLADVPAGAWWSLDSFVAAVKERAPDFQRPAGEYDSWYIRDAASGEYLRGFENWERVDGALVRWLVTEPLRWLGLVEVNKGQGTGDGDSFRVAPAAQPFLRREPEPAAAAEAARVRIGVNGVLRVPLTLKPRDRFRVARIAKWLGLEEDEYVYRLTPGSLKRAEKQGVPLERVAEFLRAIADERGLPPALHGALLRWARHGAEVALKDVVVLRVKNPELLETLRRTPRLSDYLGQVLGPTAVEIRRDDLERVRDLLAELGLLTD
jgi:hypothetical protein